MSYLRCSGLITETAETYPKCSTGWEIVPNSTIESIFQGLTIPEASSIAAAVLLLWGTAYAVRFVIKFLVGMSPGRYG